MPESRGVRAEDLGNREPESEEVRLVFQSAGEIPGKARRYAFRPRNWAEVVFPLMFTSVHVS